MKNAKLPENRVVAGLMVIGDEGIGATVIEKELKIGRASVYRLVEDEKQKA